MENTWIRDSLLATLLITSCSIFEADVTSITLDDGSSWLEDSLDTVLDLWYSKDVLYTYNVDDLGAADGESGNSDILLVTDDLGGEAIGYCYCFEGDLVSEIVIEQSLIDNPASYTACVIAHELGHYIGLNHVSDDDSIMSPVISEECEWSSWDEQELQGVSE